jgi:hypothetical protein
MAKPTIFISHIADEAGLAKILQTHIAQDFLGMLDVFVSSDSESIAAGANWLKAIEEALERANLEIVVCSRASITRPWINFEAGAGWMRRILIVPVCHSGLKPTDLPMPLRVLNGLEANSSEGLSYLYRSIAKVLNSSVPQPRFDALVKEVQEFEARYAQQLKKFTSMHQERATHALDRMMEALEDKAYEARSLKRLAIIGGVSESEALDILRAHPDVQFDSSESFGRIVKLKSRNQRVDTTG